MDNHQRMLLIINIPISKMDMFMSNSQTKEFVLTHDMKAIAAYVEGLVLWNLDIFMRVI